MLFFVRLIISIITGVVVGKIYNKFVLKYFSDNKRKLLCILTMVIFIFSSISVSVIITIKSYIDSTISSYSGKIEQYVYDTYPNNEFLLNGIDLNKTNDDFSEISNAVSELKTIIPTHVELRVNKKIYDMLVGPPMEELLNQLNTVNYSVGTYTKNVYVFADNNNFITVSSILSYFTNLATKKINAVFLGIIVVLIIPFLIYILSTIIFALIIVKNVRVR